MADKALQLDNVGKNFGGVQAVKDLSLLAPSGAITGLIGPNGAGKSTVVNLITGMLQISGGRILLNGRDISVLPPYDVTRAGIARTFQNIRLVKNATALENVMSGFHRLETTGFVSNLLGLPAARRETRALRKRAYDLMVRLGIGDFADASAQQLPYGHQRKVEIARALATSPGYLLLDEPVAGMNQIESDEVARLIVDVKNEGIGILLIEHDMRFIQKLCTQVYVLNSGQLICSGRPDEVMRNPAVIDAYLGG